MVELRALGTIDLRGQDGAELVEVLTQPKRLALALYLDLARPHGFHRRDRLVALLWPELDASHSRNALSKAIHHLRRALGDDAIVTRGDEVMLDPAFVRSDVRMLEHAVAVDDHAQAVQLYQGPLADGLFVEEAPDFERWLDAERERLRDAVANAAWALADSAKLAGRISDATAYARSAAALMREDEPSLRRLMTFLEGVGDRAGALRAYDDFASWLSAELGATPAPDTQAVHDRIRKSETVHLSHAESPAATPWGPTAVGIPAYSRGKSLPWIRVASVVSVAIVIGVLAFVLAAPKPASPTHLNPRRVAVMPFENRTGDPAFDAVGAMATDWISQEIAESRIVAVVDPRTKSTANSGLIVTGAYYKEGDRLRFQGQLSLAANGTISRVFVPVTAPLASPTKAFDSVAMLATAAIAEATDSRVAALSRVERNPPSLAAYQEYVKGVEAFTIHDDSVAVQHFLRAYELDTTFTTALLNAGASVHNRFAGSDSVIALLESKRASLTPFNQLWLDSYLASRRNDFATAYRTTGELARQSPGSYFPFWNATAAVAIGRFRSARDVLKDVDPTRGWMRNWFDYWHVRCTAQHMLGDYEAELADSRIAERQYPSNFAAIACHVRALAALGRASEIDSILDAASGMDRHGTWEVGTPYSVVAAEAAVHGYPEIAAKARKRTADWVKSLSKERLATEPPLFGPAWYLYYAQAWPEFDSRVKYLRDKYPDDPLWMILEGLSAARDGNRELAMRADSLLEAMEKPEWAQRTGRRPIPIGHFHRARIAAFLGDRDRAIQHLIQAYSNRLRYNVYDHSDPAFASIRKDPRYQRLMASRD